MKTLYGIFPIASVFLLCFIVSTPFASKAFAEVTAIQIPVIVNIYPNAGITADGAKDAIKEANKALAQANMQLVVVKTQNATEGDAGNDGEFNKEERKAVRTFGGKELKKLPNEKGLKICFGKTPTTEVPENPGISVHKDPTLIVKNRATAAETGQTIAHEIGHVMTLGAGHTVTADQKANAGGHTPNTPGEAGKENLMAPSNFRTGTKLTAAQIEEMRTRKYFVGKCSTQFKTAFPATKDKQQFGANTDNGNDQGGALAIYDLHQMFLTSLENSNLIQSQISVAAPLPGSSIGASYTLGFDSDQNVATGIAYSGLPGVDRIVQITASGIFGTSGFSLTGSVINAVTSTVVGPVDGLRAVIADSLVDVDLPGDPTETNYLFDIPKSALAIPSFATDLPVVATAGDGTSIFDNSIFDFDLIRWQEDPTLTTFGDGIPRPGVTYPFSVSGLEPLSPFDLLLDGQVVLSATLNATGDFSGGFIFPVGLPIDTLHFLTAQDSTGEFAYSMTCPTPEPVSMLLLGSGLGLLGWRSRHRKAGRA